MDALGSDDAPIERRITVTGRVQGVGFRWFARESARALGITGWARNMPDGAVVLEVAAAREAIARFVAELQTGPPAADVSDVRVVERDRAEPLPDRFVVIR